MDRFLRFASPTNLLEAMGMYSMNGMRAAVLGAMIVFTGCDNDTGPDHGEIRGSWRSDGITELDVRMTLTEMARAVEGAGSWTDATDSHAFRVTGALATDQFSLYFNFSDRADVAFEGRFVGDDRLNGVFTGGEFVDTPVIFGRDRNWP